MSAPRYVFCFCVGLGSQSAAASELCGDDPVGSLETAMTRLGDTYTSVDETAFDRAATQLEAVITCLDQVPPGATLARLHQSMALVAFVNGQKTAARRAMAAARLADPAWKLDDAAFPEGHPYRVLWSNATDPGPTSPLGTIEPRVWLIDGVARDDAPVERGFLLQVQDRGAIAAAQYLYDLEDLPDFGQDTSVAPWVTPRTWALSAGAAVRFLSADQRAQGVGIAPFDEAVPGLGGTLALRFTPIAFAGLEARAAAMGGADPVLGGTFGFEGELVGLFGAGLPIGEDRDQLYGNLRVGYARDAVQAWTEAPNDAVDPVLFSLDNLLAGAEVGYRTDELDVRGSFDTLLAGSRGLYEVRVGARGGFRLADPMALHFGITGRSGKIAITGEGDRTIGSRTDTELRVEAGPALWFE